MVWRWFAEHARAGQRLRNARAAAGAVAGLSGRAGPGRARTRPDALLGDKTYSARAHRGHLRDRGVTTVIPEPADQIANRVRRGRAGGRPVNVDKVLYRRRNVVERAFNKLKNWRGIGTRYDKHAVDYCAGVVLGAVSPWLRHVGDMP